MKQATAQAAVNAPPQCHASASVYPSYTAKEKGRTRAEVDDAIEIAEKIDI